jgi:hypothetical protein
MQGVSSMNHPDFFSQMMSNTEYFQNLFKPTSSGAAGLGSWATPTLDPQEIDKRIQELKIVQFWLEQNARLLSSTIQALEVQKLTLNTLQSMNMAMGSSHSTPNPSSPESEAQSPAAPTTAAPLEWWTALTQQFSQIATQAMQDSITTLKPAVNPVAQSSAGDSPKSVPRKTAATSSNARTRKKPSARPPSV